MHPMTLSPEIYFFSILCPFLKVGLESKTAVLFKLFALTARPTTIVFILTVINPHLPVSNFKKINLSSYMKYKKGENAIIVKNIILWFNFFSIYDSISSLIGFCVRRLD